MSDKIRVLLVDDQALFREGLRLLLSTYADLVVVGEAGNGQEGVAQAQALRPDVTLMDLRMPILDGAAATRQIKTALPDCQVIVLTTFDDDEAVFEGLRAGAVGYLLKDVSSDKLAEAVRAAARGESFLQPAIAAKVVAEFARLGQTAVAAAPNQNQTLAEPLSERELEVLACLSQGASNKEIAAQLFIAEGTVKNHITNILGKLGVTDRTQAALRGRDLGLV
jgi:DNA-binding NarL/FixJ family response regulator